MNILINAYWLKKNIDEFENLSWQQLDKIVELLNHYNISRSEFDELQDDNYNLENENENLQDELEEVQSNYNYNVQLIRDCIDLIEKKETNLSDKDKEFVLQLKNELEKYC